MQNPILGSARVTRIKGHPLFGSSGTDGLVESAGTPLSQGHFSSLHLSGELQFAFICFLLGNVYEAFEHWKRLLNLLCRSEEAMVKHHTLYINLISILYHQLGEIPADFFVDIVSQNNFLTSTLQVGSLLADTRVDRRKARACESTLRRVTFWFLAILS